MILKMQEMVERGRISRYTLMKELQNGRLHGTQSSKYGTWRVLDSCFEAWLVGVECAHQSLKTAA